MIYPSGIVIDNDLGQVNTATGEVTFSAYTMELDPRLFAARLHRWAEEIEQCLNLSSGAHTASSAPAQPAMRTRTSAISIAPLPRPHSSRKTFTKSTQSSTRSSPDADTPPSPHRPTGYEEVAKWKRQVEKFLCEEMGWPQGTISIP